MDAVLRRGIRRRILATRKLREAERALQRITNRSDRTRRSDDERTEDRMAQRRLKQRCQKLMTSLVGDTQQPQVRMKNATSVVLNRAIQRWKAGHLLSRVSDVIKSRRGATAAATTGEASEFVQVTPHHVVPSCQIQTLTDALRVLTYIQRHYIGWTIAQFRADPRYAVPRIVGGFDDDTYAPLQNLPAWQASRISLLALLLKNTTQRTRRAVCPRTFATWTQRLEVEPKYVPVLNTLRLKVR